MAVARALAEEALLASEERLALAASGTRIGMFDWDIASGKALWTEQHARLLGIITTTTTTTTTTTLSREYNYQQWAERVHPEDLPRIEAELRRCIAERLPYEAEYCVIWPDGSLHWLAGRGVVLAGSDGQPGGRMLGIVMDITARHEAEEALQASLREKEVLLHEVHHRVKNNLQVISSLVSLQSGSITGPERDAIANISDQVRAMALVHEQLYQVGDFGRIEFAEYARTLLAQLWRAHGEAAANARLTLDFEPVTLPLTASVPCGLILNELAGNALKHAFRGQPGGGQVVVSLRGEPGGQASLRVTDNGAGLPEDLDWRNAKSLGLRLVQMLSKQLGGAVEARRLAEPGGTEFELQFPLGSA